VALENIISGAFCLSSNFCGPNIEGSVFGGTGWVIEPEEDNVLGTTCQDQPFLTVEIELEIARYAKHTFPRDVRE
jgi:N-carbamoylputrescine amidase